jgi:integrase/recombinase XerD
MEPKNSLLSQQIDQLKDFLLSKGYTPGTLKFYTPSWNRLLEYANSSGVEYFTPEFGEKFLNEVCSINNSTGLTSTENKYLRGTRLLETFLQTREIARVCRQKPPFPPQFLLLQNKYADHLCFLGQKKKSLRSKLSRTKQFLDFLDTEGIQEMSCLTNENILRFFNYLKPRYSTTARCNILYTVRDFLRYNATEGIVPKDITNLIVTFNTGLNEKMPSCYSKMEVACILQSVDRKTVMGKKDYAILILIAKLGLRASDIIHIELENIKWDADVIEFYQQKTGHFIQLPLTDDVRYALLDYLKNSRSQTTFKNVFLRERAPVAPYEETATIFNIVSKYIKKAVIETGVKHHGPHSLRHSMASSLLEEKTPLPVISAALGHSSTKNTSRYLRIDIGLLRSVALEVPK